MIKANELRIGNYFNVGGNLWKVSDIITEKGKSIELYFEENDQYDHYLNAEPIPLTPEILERCGFKKELSGWQKETDSSCNDLGLEENNGKYTPIVSNGEYSVGVDIRFLHHLQNKYFDWYGEELEIKELEQTEK